MCHQQLCPPPTPPLMCCWIIVFFKAYVFTFCAHRKTISQVFRAVTVSSDTWGYFLPYWNVMSQASSQRPIDPPKHRPDWASEHVHINPCNAPRPYQLSPHKSQPKAWTIPALKAQINVPSVVKLGGLIVKTQAVNDTAWCKETVQCVRWDSHGSVSKCLIRQWLLSNCVSFHNVQFYWLSHRVFVEIFSTTDLALISSAQRIYLCVGHCVIILFLHLSLTPPW